jgi:SAM-dependent methyltransferase
MPDLTSRRTLSAYSREHLDAIASFYDSCGCTLTRSARFYRRLLAHYFNLFLRDDASVLEIGCGDGELLALLRGCHKTGVDLSGVQLARARRRLPTADLIQQSGEELDLSRTFDAIVVSDTLNLAGDVERLLSRLHAVATPNTRLLLSFQNNLWRPVFRLGSWLGLRSRQPLCSWLSRHDVASLLNLSGWEVVKSQPRLLWPLRTPLIAWLCNRFLAPLLPWMCAVVFTVARPRPQSAAGEATVSVVVPARNEAGNIEAAARRIPEMGSSTEIIFVEGNSTDETWAEIQRVKQAFPNRRIKAVQQSGRGKANAVREGFAVAEGDVFMILDADLTMPPEELPKFYAAIRSGIAEFANGSRLVYGMERQAMQFLNMIANHLFGHAFSWLLGQRLKDTLCGTKALSRSHYLQIAANRAYFGDFDPFGDFDLLFGADKLNLKVVDIPIRYRQRTYGKTNIHRWRHGWLLLRMVLFAARKLKFV